MPSPFQPNTTGLQQPPPPPALSSPPPPPPLSNCASSEEGHNPNRPASPSPSLDALGEKPFPIDALPMILQKPLLELVRVFGIEPGMAAGCLLGAVSSSLGKGLWLEHVVHTKTPPNLHIMGVGASGQFKTTTFGWCYDPITRKEEEMIRNYNLNTLPSLLSQKKGIEAQIKALTNGKHKMTGEEVIAHLVPLQRKLAQVEELSLTPRLTIEDATGEGIVRTFPHGNGALALCTDDGRKVISNICGRYQKDGVTDEEVFLKSYSVTDIAVDRAGNRPIHIKKACLAALILIQHDKFQKVVSKPSLLEGGFLQRFLLFASHSEPVLWTVDQPKINDEAFAPYYGRIDELLETYRLRKEGHLCALLSFGARLELVGYRNHVVQNLRPQYLSHFATFVDRWPENWCRVALVLHAAEHGAKAHSLPLSVATAQAAKAIMGWFIEQQVGLLTGVRETQESAVADRVFQLLARRGPLSTRAIVQSKVVVNTVEAHRVLECLQSKGLVMQQPGSPAWMIHPGAKP